MKEELKGACVTSRVPWSIVDSASSNSQLAGVLAGLLVATITVLIASGRLREIRTLGLLSAAMVALALDSYLFSYLTGLDTTNNRKVCARAWVQGMTASGVLALGAIALIVGIAVMLVQRIVTLEDGNEVLTDLRETQTEKLLLVKISAAMAGAVVAATTILLAAAFQQYLAYLDGPIWACWAVYGAAVVIVLRCWAAIVVRVLHLKIAIKNRYRLKIETNALPKAARYVVGHALLASGYGALMIYGNGMASTLLGIIATYFITVGVPAYVAVLCSKSFPTQLWNVTPEFVAMSTSGPMPHS